MKRRTCEDFQELASALADERLNSREIRVIQGHLEKCPECRRFLSNVHRVKDILRAAEVRDSFHVPSTSFAAAVSSRLDGEELFPGTEAGPVAAPYSFWSRMSGAAAAAVLLFAAGWSWYSLSPSPDTAPIVASQVAQHESEEDSVTAYYRQHALQTMEVTLLGPSEGIELASFDTFGTNFE